MAHGLNRRSGGATMIAIAAMLGSVASAAEWPRADFGRFYRPVTVEVKPGAAQVALPLDPSAVRNAEQAGKLLTSPGAADLFAAHGFVVLGPAEEDDFVAMYEQLQDRGYPILVTSDAVLHLYHVQFDDLLKTAEEESFAPDLKALLAALLDDAQTGYERSDGLLRDAYAGNVRFLGVAASLLGGEPRLPDWARSAVAQDLGRIEAHAGFEDSAVFGYAEDFSQYVPRGHYTRSEELQRYFRAMMWLGRMPFVASAKLVPPEVAHRQTVQAALLAEALPGVRVGDRTGSDVWARLYDVTSFFVGVADDPTPREYATALAAALGQGATAKSLVAPEAYDRFRAELARRPQPMIYSGTGAQVIVPGPGGELTPEQLDEVLAATKGMRFMGQRFVPDSYAMGRLVAPTVSRYTGDIEPFTLAVTDAGPVRAFPRGLDVMSLLGFDIAGSLLRESGDADYEGYDEALAKLRGEFSGLTPEDWQQNLYWAWLSSLRALAPRPGAGYPSFMQTEAWAVKQLNAALGSWSQLRHDTILYVKQSYTVGATAVEPQPPPPPPGFVEPVPELYARLLALSRMTKAGLSDARVLSAQQTWRLDAVEDLLGRLLAMSTKELEGRDLNEEDNAFLRSFAGQLERSCAGMDTEGLKTTLVADVHTEGNTMQVLEEGTGDLMVVVAAMPMADGKAVAAVGPVFSYYEFKEPMGNRLTDEAWRQMLKGGGPALPDWYSIVMPTRPAGVGAEPPQQQDTPGVLKPLGGL